VDTPKSAQAPAATRPTDRITSPTSAPGATPTKTPFVLIVEDEEKTRTSLAKGLGLEGWSVRTAEEGGYALQLIEAHVFDLIILDWMLPGYDGLAIVRQVRARGIPTPVLMLTVRDSINDRVTGLEAGADDYVTKPFAFAELVARSRALLRRPAMNNGHLLRSGDLQLDTRARVAVRNGREIPLTPREVDILEYLLINQDQVVTREMLERDVWKQTRRFTSLNNVIDVQIMRLRRKVDDGCTEKLIHTLRGVGYRLGKEAS
jgi:two-component system copper resistance phosphate regulon response regulator CusR